MKYSDTGFRAIYRNFTAFPVNEKIRRLLAGYPGAEKANCALMFGYIDREGEAALAAIACGRKDGSICRFFDAADKSRSILARDVSDEEFLFLDRRDGSLGKRYEAAISGIGSEEDEIAQTRRMGFIDSQRDWFRPDEVRVYLTGRGLQMEDVQVRITGIGDGYILGRILSLPEQDFGVSKGDAIAFVLQEISEGNVICVSNQERRKLTREDIKDGRLLRNAVKAYKKDKNEDTYIDVLELLRDSKLWAPCEVFLPKEGPVDGDTIRIAPRLFRKGGKAYLPLFTDENGMNSLGEGYTKVNKGILFWMDMAGESEIPLQGIVIDPFTDSFMLRKDVFEVLRGMKSSLMDH